ncbi:SMI1/KNR4 family protein [Burkholderia sp. AU30198]|uniref:SMI1/KNR4 family protein n=1 Tax=Burkholderia sp. AU30198 TaxID=2879627 RepID=UPI001CF5651C|nr:SMI1/KNR4 family protein [Burkholderia sp. AU30198]MCA8298419.1 SMI1/KNR4 family protein [Burkholderia sp. AU30198]
MTRTATIGTTTAEIEAAEAALGRALPHTFAAWLLLNNGRSLGGLPVFPVFDARNPRKTWNSIVRHYNEGWREWRDNFDHADADFSTLLPFAEFGTGDYYCFDYDRIDASLEPAIVLWSHETGETAHVADDFATFLSMRGHAGAGAN